MCRNAFFARAVWCGIANAAASGGGRLRVLRDAGSCATRRSPGPVGGTCRRRPRASPVFGSGHGQSVDAEPLRPCASVDGRLPDPHPYTERRCGLNGQSNPRQPQPERELCDVNAAMGGNLPARGRIGAGIHGPARRRVIAATRATLYGHQPSAAQVITAARPLAAARGGTAAARAWGVSVGTGRVTRPPEGRRASSGLAGPLAQPVRRRETGRGVA